MSAEYTKEQVVAVQRVMKLKSDAYYEILVLEKTCSGAEVKKAYRRQALVMHPDKNKAPNADEAFKRVSKAFQVLSDEAKRRIFDQTGCDPDSRGNIGAGPAGFGAARNPFGPRARYHAHPADDLFSQFFGGPAMGGPQFQFQFGGGGGDPNDIFSQLFGESLFGGAPRRAQARGRQRQAPGEQGAKPASKVSTYLNLLLIVGVLVVPTLLGWLFDAGGASTPGFLFEARTPYTEQRHTPKYNVPFYTNPKDTVGLSSQKLRSLDRVAENQFVSMTRAACNTEYLHQQQQMQDAVGWFSTDQASYEAARRMPLPHCDVLKNLGIRLRE